MSKIEYRVRSGDTLSAIARKHNTAVEALKRTNWLASEDSIVAGQVLHIERTGVASNSQSKQGIATFIAGGGGGGGVSGGQFKAKGKPGMFSGARSHEAPSLTSVTSGNASLELGMQGPAVRELQRLLVLTGYLSQQKMNTGPGMFGLATLAAVKDFQRANRIPPLGGRPSGTADRSIFEALYKTRPANTAKDFAHSAQSNEAAKHEEASRRAAAAMATASKVTGKAKEPDSVFEVVWNWLWGTLQGDFNKDPSLSQIAVNTVLGLIPLVDQVLDLRDIIAGLKDLIEYYLEDDAEQKNHSGVLGLNYELWLWINVFIIAIGCIPEVGSVVKGVLRAVIEALQKAGKNADTQLWKTLLPILKRLAISESSAKTALKELSAKLSGWMATATTKIKSGLQSIQSLLTAAENVIGSKAAKLLPKKTADELLESIRKLKAALKKIYDRLDAMKAEVNRWLREQIERLIGKPVAKTNVPSTSTPASKEQRHSSSPRNMPSGNTKGIKNTTGAQKPLPKNKTPPNTSKPSNDGTTPPKKPSSSGTPLSTRPPSTQPHSEKPPPRESLSKEPPTSRPAPRSLDELYAQLSEKARKSFDQQKQLISEERFRQMEGAYKNPDGTYDPARANQFFEKMLLDDIEFAKALKKVKDLFLNETNKQLKRIKNSVEETNGTNRPNSKLGNGTSEEALVEEIATGAPYGCDYGHHVKIMGYIETLEDAIAKLGKYRKHIEDPRVLAGLDASIQAGLLRLQSMKPTWEKWKQRVKTHPSIWNADGTSKVKPGWP